MYLLPYNRMLLVIRSFCYKIVLATTSKVVRFPRCDGMKRFYWLCYYAPDYELRAKAYPFHKVRDAFAMVELSAALDSLGYSYAEALMNYPSEDHAEAKVEGTASSPGEDDLVVLTTRPPINDEDEEARGSGDCEGSSPKGRGVRTVNRSHTPLEEDLFSALKPFLVWCSRSQVKLSPVASRHLQSLAWKKWQRGKSPVEIGPKPTRWNVEFSLNVGAAVRAFDMETSDLKTTLGYLWYSAPANARHGLLAAWGMGGRESVIWARILRTTCRELLRNVLGSSGDRFVIAEFPAVDLWRPAGLEFVDNVAVEAVEGCL